jgi:hypothetical protein
MCIPPKKMPRCVNGRLTFLQQKGAQVLTSSPSKPASFQLFQNLLNFLWNSIFTRPKMWGIFAPPLRHVIKKSTAVGSHVDGLDHRRMLFVRDPIYLVGPTCGTHADSNDIRVGPTHIACGTHNSIEWDS